jgi:heat shock protein HtpX
VELGTATKFKIETSIAPTYHDSLLPFIQENYLLPHPERFLAIERGSDDQGPTLSYLAMVPDVGGHVHVKVSVRNQWVEVEMAPGAAVNVSAEALEDIKDDLFTFVNLFEERVRQTTLYFAWAEGESIIPEEPPNRKKNLFVRIFSGGMLALSVLFLALNILLFIFFGPLAPLMIVGAQLVTVLISPKIIARGADWQLTEKNPNIHIAEYELPVDDYAAFQKRFGSDFLTRMKKDIYARTFAAGKPLTCEAVGGVLSGYGFECRPENMVVRTVDVYTIVRRAASAFSLHIPKILIANTTVANAAAAGASPDSGVALITTGLLVELDDEEVLNVVGHEFSHLKGRDPLALFGITTGTYLAWFYIIGPFLDSSGLGGFSFFLYLLSLSIVYFVAKFFESRADLEAAVRIGEPEVMASALRKIGFQKLQLERVRLSRVFDWLGWDTHPPIYFRVGRLERLRNPEKVKHSMIQSISDNAQGFVEALF